MLPTVVEQGEQAVPTWTVQCESMGMMLYYRIYDPVKGQRLLYDLIEYVLYGKVCHGKQLNPLATPFEMPIINNGSTNSIDFVQEEKKTPQSHHKSNRDTNKYNHDKTKTPEVNNQQWIKVKSTKH